MTKRKRAVPYEENHKVIDDIEHKKCAICENFYPMNTDYFYKNKSNSIDGLHPYCKDCAKIKSHTWTSENRDRKNEWKYHYRRKEKQIDYDREIKKKRREEGYNIEWQRNNPDKVKFYANVRKSKKHEISKKEWEDCKEYFNYQCAYCNLSESKHKELYKQQLHKEHVDKDGSNDLSNCVPACRSCNSSKSDWELEQWYREDNYQCDSYSEERLQKIHKWLNEDYKFYIKPKKNVKVLLNK